MAISSVEQLLETFQKELAQVPSLVALAINPDSLLPLAITGSDRDMRWAVEDKRESRISELLTNSLRHNAWKKYFELIQLSKVVNSDTYWKAQVGYVYDNAEKRTFQNSSIKELHDFTAENIKAFEVKFLTISEEALKKSVKTLLYRIGDWRSRPDLFKKRQTFKGKLSVATLDKCVMDTDFKYELADALLAVKHFKGETLAPTELDNIRVQISAIDKPDTEISLMDGVSIILKLSGSIEMRLNETVVNLLNSLIAETV